MENKKYAQDSNDHDRAKMGEKMNLSKATEEDGISTPGFKLYNNIRL